MSFNNENAETFSGEPTPQTSNSFSIQTNPFQYPIYSVPQPGSFPPAASYATGNIMGPGPSLHANILVPPFPPPYPPPYPPPFPPPFHQHSGQFHSIDSLSFPFQPGANTPRVSLTVEADLCNKYHEPVPFSPAASRFNDIDLYSSKISISRDELWVQKWLSNEHIKKEEQVKNSPIKIHKVKECFKNCLKIIQDLEHLKKTMVKHHKDADELSWSNLTTEFIEKKNEVTEILNTLPSVSDLQKVIVKRSKKRSGQKLRRVKWKETKSENKEKRLKLHHQIDTWLQDMQKTIDLGKREESLKKEADSVLSDVLRKKAEGRRQLSLVTSLVKLRQLRAKSAANKGLHILVDEGIRFTKIAEHLKGLWEKQLEEYDVEEKGMRVMLSEAVDERDQSQATQEKRILSQWNRLLFGAEQTLFPEFYLAAERDGDVFIATRQAWDRWIAAPDAPVKSNIPIGWVLPCNPSSPQWEKLLFS